MPLLMGIIAISLGFWAGKNPVGFLKHKDRFRIKGEREYTSFAIKSTVFGGVFMVILGIVLIIVSFTGDF